MDIIITSGEGEYGTDEVYTGKRTMRALRSRLTREECGGDRWAIATWDNGEPVYMGSDATDEMLGR